LDSRPGGARDRGATLAYQLGDRPIGFLLRVRAEELVDLLPEIRLGTLQAGLLMLVPFGQLIQSETGAADQRPQLGRPAVDELGAQLDGVLQRWRVNRVDPSAYPIATFEDHDLPAGGGQMVSGREARDPRAQDEDLIGRATRRRAIRSGVP
jgi:hypothetical protein